MLKKLFYFCSICFCISFSYLFKFFINYTFLSVVDSSVFKKSKKFKASEMKFKLQNVTIYLEMCIFLCCKINYGNKVLSTSLQSFCAMPWKQLSTIISMWAVTAVVWKHILLSLHRKKHGELFAKGFMDNAVAAVTI